VGLSALAAKERNRHRGLIRLLAVALVAAVTAVITAAAAQAGAWSTTTTVLTAAAAQAGTSDGLSLSIPAKDATYGEPITVTGTVVPLAEGVEILIVRPQANGDPLASVVTDADGRFSATFDAPNTKVQALAMSLGLSSDVVALPVAPALSTKVKKTRAFTNAKVTIRANPASATGRATVTVKRNGKVTQTKRVYVSDGKATTNVVAPGPRTYKVVVEFDPRGALVAGESSAVGKTRARYLSIGSDGPDVVGLIRRLRELKIHVPPITTTYTEQVKDAVLVLQKLSGLERTGVMAAADWRKLATVDPVQATQKGPKNRIEVDKTRQVLIKVRNGDVVGTLHVSTGLTNNTPEGRHNIRWKAPTTTTWLGPGILYRTLTFVGNSFAIHGWSDVPAYAASSGCVRIPNWTADWLYNNSPVGESVIIHS
jgi:lipoprotein-anchoring transpeptidase ErfK/SrfK